MTTRRGFLQFIGAAIAGSALPVEFAGAKVLKAPVEVKRVLRFACPELPAGDYSFSAWVKLADRNWEQVTAQVNATGGETVLEFGVDEDGSLTVGVAALESGAIPTKFEDVDIHKDVARTIPYYRQFEKRSWGNAR